MFRVDVPGFYLCEVDFLITDIFPDIDNIELTLNLSYLYLLIIFKMKKGKIALFIIAVTAIVACTVFSYFFFQRSISGTPDPAQFRFDKPEGIFQYLKEITTPPGAGSSGYKPNYAYNEFLKAKVHASKKKASLSSFQWIQRGPVNVGGRTRCILVDPDDPFKKTWFAGTASGGIWKTTNAGQTWINLTPGLANLSTTTLTMVPSDHNVIYAGTGEGYGGEGMVTGNGIFKSTDRGATWTIISSTDGNENFRYVNKIWIDPGNKNIIIAVTNTAVLKSVDEGLNWQIKFKNGYRVQDIVQNPLNPDILYAGVNTTGVIKSVDKGEKWFKLNRGMGMGYRFNLAVSPVDTSYVFACVENRIAEMDVYLSVDGGSNWVKQKDKSGIFYNFHRGQGWFNSVIKPHPFNKKEVYVAGVYMGKVAFEDSISKSAPQVLIADTSGTSNFLDFINFGGEFFEGGMSTGLKESAVVTINDFVSVELRFGPGKHQKAHRFTVPVDRGPGVVAAEYEYKNYVDVPFEVWDTKNNRQLMVSFRDQERDSLFNLIIRDPNNDLTGREYIFIQAISYDSINPSPVIAKYGGHFEKMMYFFWPTLAADQTWTPSSLPESKIQIVFGTSDLRDVTTYIIHDDSKNLNLHVDHHDLAVLPGASPADQITLIDANDGGVAISSNGGETWTQLTNGYITTQFYGVAKKPDAYEYIGGMQDNGTWQSPSGTVATNTTEYISRLGGDGFQAVWNKTNTRKLLASIYNNNVYLSTNGGGSWRYASNGLNNDGPFISKLTNSKAFPDVVFAVGSQGVYKHTRFGDPFFNWELVRIQDGWTIDNTAYSSMNIKISPANPNIVWAGTGMYKNPKLKVFLSKDFGVTFDTVNNYDLVDMGLMSGMATHPENPAEAFMLFSYQGNPKILRTYDYGKSWTDISGFGTDSISSNGFPDVIVHDLVISPVDTTMIWAATEIGIFESTDDGLNWHFLDGNLPAVSVFQLYYQDDQFVAATYGRGIWTANLWPVGVKNNQVENKSRLSIYPNPAVTYLNFNFTSDRSGMADVRVMSISGQTILSQKNRIESGEILNRQIDISGLKPGTYILEVKIGDSSSTGRFIKQD